MNGLQIKSDQLVFIENDPQIILTGLKGIKRLEISYDIRLIGASEKGIFQNVLQDRQAIEDQAKQLADELVQAEETGRKYQQQIKENEDKIAYQSQVITNMENTKIWKAYEKYKRTFKKS
jgi:hypothetical protein